MDKPMPLPIELVLHVIICSVPPQGVILDSSHDITKTLVSFTLVCRETRRLATRLLRQNCVSLDSPERLRSFLLQIPNRLEWREVAALSLAPFGNDIDDLPLCSWVRELLSYACDSLKKLVIDIPLRTCYPEDDHLNVRPVLRQGFERLVNLEEFVSVRDELYLDVADREHACVWKAWPKLKRLALWNVDADADFWWHVAKHPTLDTLVLSNPDSLTEVNPKAEYFKHTNRPLKIIFCKTQQYRSSLPDYLQDANWEKHDPERNMIIIAHPLRQVVSDSLLYPSQRYVKQAAENGTLWEWEGEEIHHPAQMRLVC